MNYYEHHIGDYAEATAHLSFVEDAAYARCIRKYYALERPLPTDVKAVQRLIGARTREEKAAVETVLNEFFERHDDGWHQKRCDEEIARFSDKRSKAQRSAGARWNAMRTDSERNANASETHMQKPLNKDANAMQTQFVGNALQSPGSRLQEEDLSSVLNSTSAARAREDTGNFKKILPEPRSPEPRGARKNGSFEHINAAVGKLLASGACAADDPNGIAKIAGITLAQARESVRQLRAGGQLQ